MVTIVLVGWANTAAAKPVPWGEPRWRVDALAGTDFPLDVNARVQAETPFRLRFGVGFGVMPGAYLQAIDAVAVAAGWYRQEDADAIEDTLSGAFTIHPFVGVRPSKRHGFVADVGYKVALLGGDTTPVSLISALTGTPPPTLEPDEPRTFEATAILHMVTVRAGWEWEPVQHLAVRFDIGGAFTVASQTTITPTFETRVPQLWEPLTSAGETYLNDTFRRYVHVPTIGLSLGYRWY